MGGEKDHPLPKNGGPSGGERSLAPRCTDPYDEKKPPRVKVTAFLVCRILGRPITVWGKGCARKATKNGEEPTERGLCCAVPMCGGPDE